MSNDREFHPKDERESVQPEEPVGISRRRFLRGAALGAAAAGAALALGEGEALAQTEDTGDVTVDGLMLTYIASPLGSIGSASWTVQKSNTHTMRVVAAASRGISIRSDISAGITETFSVGGSTEFRQSAGTSVTNSITLRRTSTQTVTTPTPGAVGNTVIVGLLKPKARFRGDTSSLRFKFLSANSLFAIKISDFQSGAVNHLFSAATISSFLAQYPPLNDPSGSTVIKPRFKLRLNILLSPGVTDVFSFTKSTGSTHADTKSATTSVEIVEKTGFTLFGLLATTFSTDLMVSYSITLNRTTLGVNQVYWDRAWKTFLTLDKGAPSATQPKVAGVVTDTNGFAISGAYVKVVQDNAEWAARTNGSGGYSIETPPGQPLSTGTYPVLCGDRSLNVNIGSGSGTYYANLSSVDLIASRETGFSGETYNLN
jgi:hypothetical protein